jgi:hypothetical protein
VDSCCCAEAAIGGGCGEVCEGAWRGSWGEGAGEEAACMDVSIADSRAITRRDEKNNRTDAQTCQRIVENRI